MMICSTAIACSCLPGQAKSVSVEPAGSSVTTALGTTAGSQWWSAKAWKCCGRGSAGSRGCPTTYRPGSRSESSASRSAIQAWVRVESQPNWPCQCGAASWFRPVVCSRFCVATAWAPAFSASAWSPAMPPSRNGRPRPSPSRCTSRSSQPGDLVQVDCFYIGRLSGTKGRTWQYTAIDVASSFVWASVQVSEVNPDTKHCSALVRRVASDLAAAGWRLKAVSTDNGGEFRAEPFARSLASAGAKQRFIRAGRPQTNGAVERVHRTILEECWRPSFARALVPRYTALKRDLEAYLSYYNYERAHTGRRNLGRPPAELVYGARKMRPR